MSIKLENISMEMLELSVDDLDKVVGGAPVQYIVFTDDEVDVITPKSKRDDKQSDGVALRV